MRVAGTYPGVEPHLVMGNCATHKKAKVRAWLAENPTIHVRFTPRSGSWLNMVAIWFGIIERQAIHRGSFTAVTDLMRKFRQFITGWHQCSCPSPGPNPRRKSSRKPSQRTTSNTPH
jgi:hypothetical protein